MAKTVELLLIENVEGTGIVGDVVKVRKGYARNYLLPRTMATVPSADKIKELAGKRADAEKQLAELRKHREGLIAKLSGLNVEMIRSCNDLGILYGAVTQHDMSVVLAKAGFPGIKDREIRMAAAIKRIDNYNIVVKFANDLEANVTLHIKPDRELEIKRSDQASPEAMAQAEAEAAGIVKRPKDKTAKVEVDEAPADKAADAKDADGEKPKAKKGDEPKPEAAKPEKSDKGDKAGKGEPTPKSEKGGWAKPAEKTEKAEKADKPAKAEKSEKSKK